LLFFFAADVAEPDFSISIEFNPIIIEFNVLIRGAYVSGVSSVTVSVLINVIGFFVFVGVITVVFLMFVPVVFSFDPSVTHVTEL